MEIICGLPFFPSFCFEASLQLKRWFVVAWPVMAIDTMSGLSWLSPSSFEGFAAY